MHSRIAHDHESAGRWQHAIEAWMRQCAVTPSIWPSIKLEVDRLLRQHAGDGGGFGFSRRGLSSDALRRVRRLGWTPPADLFDRGIDAGRLFVGDIVHEALQLEKRAGVEAALAWAWENASGREVDALDLLLARACRDDDVLWTQHLNNYLAPHRLAIQLARANGESRFGRLLAAQVPAARSEGPLVSVLMPVHRAAGTLWLAANSILAQSWRSLELILVDDASDDDSWAVCQRLAALDTRVRIQRNPVNVGPYVSKNVALQMARGQYLTCHDADDWAFPDRIAHQMSLLDSRVRATSGRMLRLAPDGEPTRPVRTGPASSDGYVRPCFVSLLVERRHFEDHLGAWDHVRVAADSELMERAQRAPGGVRDDPRILMLCLDLEEGLTRHPVYGLESTGRLRPQYQRAWRQGHERSPDRLRYQAWPPRRAYEAPVALLVPADALHSVYGAVGTDVSLPATLLEAPPATTPPANGPDGAAGPQRDALAGFDALAALHGSAQALDWVDRNGDRSLRHTLELLQANIALSRGDLSAGIGHINRYLRKFEMPPISLADTTLQLDQLRADELPAVTAGPLVSVVLTLGPHPSGGEAAARSVLRQTWQRLELILVDPSGGRMGGDGAGDWVQRLVAEDPRVRVHRTPAHLPSAAVWLAAARQASGEFVASQSWDSWSHPLRVERQVRALQRLGDAVDAHACHMLPLDARGQVGPFVRTSDPEQHSHDGAARLWPGGVLIRAGALQSTGLQQALLGAEYAVLHRQLARALAGAWCSDPFVGALSDAPAVGAGSSASDTGLRLA